MWKTIKVFAFKYIFFKNYSTKMILKIGPSSIQQLVTRLPFIFISLTSLVYNNPAFDPPEFCINDILDEPYKIYNSDYIVKLKTGLTLDSQQVLCPKPSQNPLIIHIMR